MIIETSVVDFSRNLSVMLKQVQHQHDSIVIDEGGTPAVVLIDIRLFNQVRRMAARFEKLCVRLEAGFAQTPEARGISEIDAVCKAERRSCEAVKVALP